MLKPTNHGRERLGDRAGSAPAPSLVVFLEVFS